MTSKAATASPSTEFETLLDRLRRGDEDAAWQLVCEYGPHVVAVVRRKLSRQIRVRLDSQDVVQAVWKSFFLDMAGIDDIRSPEQLIAVLSRMTHNKMVDAYRRHLYTGRRGAIQEHRFAPEEHRQRTASPEGSPSQFAMARERWRQMLSERSPVQQEVIRRRLTGETFEAIAVSLGISERTARRVIGDLWQEQCHDKA